MNAEFIKQIINEEYIDEWIKNKSDDKDIFDFFKKWSRGNITKTYYPLIDE